MAVKRVAFVGAPEDVEDVGPLMRAMGERLFRCGKLGSAAVVKLINNMIGITMMYLGTRGDRTCRSP